MYIEKIKNINFDVTKKTSCHSAILMQFFNETEISYKQLLLEIATAM